MDILPPFEKQPEVKTDTRYKSVGIVILYPHKWKVLHSDGTLNDDVTNEFIRKSLAKNINIVVLILH